MARDVTVLEPFAGVRCPITMRLRFAFALSALGFTLSSPQDFAQTPRPQSAPAQTAVALHPPLLPESFGPFKATGDTSASPTEPAFSLVNANKAALEESSPQRSAVEGFSGQGRTLHVEAVEFKDASGALAAFSMLSQPGMHEVKGLGQYAVEGDGGVIFFTGASVAVVFPASGADVASLKALADVMPKPVGSAAQQPLLPSLLPSKGLVAGSLRYALGQQDYMAEGGVLPAAGLGWNQSGEAVTAKYDDRRGKETLTLLLYPTPTIAGGHLRSAQALIPGLGPSFAKAKARREGSLLIVADGSFSADAAQALVENTHLRQFASTDRAMPTPEVVETRKTFGMLADVIVFSGVLGISAIVIGLFLGGGRALVRILRGKPAATETEFLSLHLEPQNPAAVFNTGETREQT